MGSTISIRGMPRTTISPRHILINDHILLRREKFKIAFTKRDAILYLLGTSLHTLVLFTLGVFSEAHFKAFTQPKQPVDMEQDKT